MQLKTVGLAVTALALALPLMGQEGCGEETADEPEKPPAASTPRKETLVECLRAEDIDVERRSSDTLRLTLAGDFARIKRFTSAKEAKKFAKQLDPSFIEATTRIGRRVVTYDRNESGDIPDVVETCSGRAAKDVKAKVAPQEPPPPPEPAAPPEPDPAPEPPPEPAADCHPDYGGCLDPNASDYDCEGGSGRRTGVHRTGREQGRRRSILTEMATARPVTSRQPMWAPLS